MVKYECLTDFYPRLAQNNPENVVYRPIPPYILSLEKPKTVNYTSMYQIGTVILNIKK